MYRQIHKDKQTDSQTQTHYYSKLTGNPFLPGGPGSPSEPLAPGGPSSPCKSTRPIKHYFLCSYKLFISFAYYIMTIIPLKNVFFFKKYLEHYMRTVNKDNSKNEILCLPNDFNIKWNYSLPEIL